MTLSFIILYIKISLRLCLLYTSFEAARCSSILSVLRNFASATKTADVPVQESAKYVVY